MSRVCVYTVYRMIIILIILDVEFTADLKNTVKKNKEIIVAV